jgi:hypothetical protein
MSTSMVILNFTVNPESKPLSGNWIGGFDVHPTEAITAVKTKISTKPSAMCCFIDILKKRMDE